MSWLIHVSSGPLNGHLAIGGQRGEPLPSFWVFLFSLVFFDIFM